ncbi:hypothetical protein OH77DRAFT_1423025 [Trametes cingulata]|nr:hypothetical protein OH77DRAFT_1423025 [Trametes cingulata]
MQVRHDEYLILQAILSTRAEDRADVRWAEFINLFESRFNFVVRRPGGSSHVFSPPAEPSTLPTANR